MSQYKYNGRRLRYFCKEASDFIDAAGLTSDSNLNVEGLYTAEQARYAVDSLIKGLKSYDLWTKCISLFPYVAGTSHASTQNVKDLSKPITWSGNPIFNWDGVNDNNINANYGQFNVNTSLDTSNITLMSYIGNKDVVSTTNINRGVLGDERANNANVRLQIFRVGINPNGLTGSIGTNQSSLNFTSNGYKGFQALTRTNNAQIRCWSNFKASSQSPITVPITNPSTTTTFYVLNCGYYSDPSELSLQGSGLYYGLTDIELSKLNIIMENFNRLLNRSPFII